MKYSYIIYIIMFAAGASGNAQELSTGVSQEVEKQNSNEVNSANQESDQKSGNKYEGVEKLQVTGSHIRRSDIEGPSPVIVIDREKIEASGFNTVGQLLRASTASPFGGENSPSAVNLRGIGSSRTLVLLNGQRLPQSGSSFSTGAIDTDFVPLAAVDRVEILKDGASATYGSDALGGVVNIITRKDLQGYSFASKYDQTSPIGGDTWTNALAWGKSTANFNIITSLQHRYRQHRRRSAQENQQAVNSRFFFSTNYVNDASQTVAGPNCGRVNSDTGRCEVQRAFEQNFLDFHEITSATDVTAKIGSDIEVYSTLLLQYYKDEDEFPAGIFATPGPSGGVGIQFTPAEVPAAWYAALPDLTPGNGTTIYGVIPELGSNYDTDENYVGGLLLGTRGYIGDTDWQWDVTLNNQVNVSTSISRNSVLYADFRQKLLTGAYNPLDNGTNRDVSGLALDLRTRNRFVTNWLEAKTTGEFGSGLSAAFGVSGAHFEYEDDRDDRITNQEVMGLTGSQGKGGKRALCSFRRV